MPAAHPSPHRFLAPAAASTPSAAQQQQPKPKPKSSLRHALTFNVHPPSAATTTNANSTQLPPTKPSALGKRFLVAPGQRSGVGGANAGGDNLTTGLYTTLPAPRAPDRVEDHSSSAETNTDTYLDRDIHTSHVRARARVRRRLARVESIEETSQSSPPLGATGLSSDEDGEGEQEEEGAGMDVVQSVEQHEAMFGSAAEEEETEEELEGDDATAPFSHQLDALTEDAENENNEDKETDLLFTPPPKRRRVSTPTPSTPAAATGTASATTTAAAQKPPHRFRIPAPQTTPARTPLSNNPFTPGLTIPSLTTTTPTTTASKKRPSAAFLLSPSATHPPTSPNDPNTLAPTLNLPEIFSPSRRTGRFLPGGLAQTVQGWLVEAAAAATASSTTMTTRERMGESGREREKEKERGIRLRARITSLQHSHTAQQQQQQEEEVQQEVSVHPGTHLLAHATTDPGLYNTSRLPQDGPSPGRAGVGRAGVGTSAATDEDFGIRVLLAGQGGGGGRSGRGGAVGTKVKVGDVVGIRAPLWDVCVGEDGEKWVVGVEWVVL